MADDESPWTVQRDGSAAVELREAAVQMGGRTIWSEVSMRIAAGEFVALLGANGSGKSTMLKAILGAVRPTAGTITVLGSPAGVANARSATSHSGTHSEWGRDCGESTSFDWGSTAIDSAFHFRSAGGRAARAGGRRAGAWTR